MSPSPSALDAPGAAALFAVFDDVVSAVRGALGGVDDAESWRDRGARSGQYGLDVIADEAALAVLDRSGLGVLSEESGRHRPDHPVCVVVDPVDGSTNASRRIPWYATSLCAVDASGPAVAQVTNLATGTTWRAVRGGGATRDGRSVSVAAPVPIGDALVVVNGYPARHLGWRQFRSLGATALDLCLVADGSVDVSVDVSGALGAWDYLASYLVITEAGGFMCSRDGELVVLDHDARRSVLAASHRSLLDEVLAGSTT